MVAAGGGLGGGRNNPRAWLQPYPQRAPKLGVLVASRFASHEIKRNMGSSSSCSVGKSG